jgi:hypothetical protein
LHWKKYWKDLWWLPSHDLGHMWSPKCALVEGWDHCCEDHSWLLLSFEVNL